MIDAGADAVVGGHPHVTQGASLYRGRPIVWSLGNFVFDGFNTVASTTGWLLQLDVDQQGAAGFRVTVAHQDEAGTAHLSRDAAPCWRRGEPAVSLRCGAASP